jgi:hypothetical protein
VRTRERRASPQAAPAARRCGPARAWSAGMAPRVRARRRAAPHLDNNVDDSGSPNHALGPKRRSHYEEPRTRIVSALHSSAPAPAAPASALQSHRHAPPHGDAYAAGSAQSRWRRRRERLAARLLADDRAQRRAAVEPEAPGCSCRPWPRDRRRRLSLARSTRGDSVDAPWLRRLHP